MVVLSSSLAVSGFFVCVCYRFHTILCAIDYLFGHSLPLSVSFSLHVLYVCLFHFALHSSAIHSTFHITEKECNIEKGEKMNKNAEFDIIPFRFLYKSWEPISVQAILMVLLLLVVILCYVWIPS